MKKPYLTPTIEFVYLGLPKNALLSDATRDFLPDSINLIQGSPVP